MGAMVDRCAPFIGVQILLECAPDLVSKLGQRHRRVDQLEPFRHVLRHDVAVAGVGGALPGQHLDDEALLRPRWPLEYGVVHGCQSIACRKNGS